MGQGAAREAPQGPGQAGAPLLVQPNRWLHSRGVRTGLGTC